MPPHWVRQVYRRTPATEPSAEDDPLADYVLNCRALRKLIKCRRALERGLDEMEVSFGCARAGSSKIRENMAWPRRQAVGFFRSYSAQRSWARHRPNLYRRKRSM